MAKKTVLEYVQQALNIMDSDNVDSINDTVESLQVADLLKDIYFEFVNRKWAWLERPIRLNTAADPTQPTKLLIGDNIRSVLSVQYNISAVGEAPEFKPVTFLPPSEFLTRSLGKTSNIQLVEQDGLSYYISTDGAPSFYTSFDDMSIVFSSYDNTINTTVEPSRVSVYGEVIPAFTLADSFVPDLPTQYVPLMQSMLNKAAMEYYKQAASQTDQERITRQTGQLRREATKTRGSYDYYQNKFGRK